MQDLASPLKKVATKQLKRMLARHTASTFLPVLVLVVAYGFFYNTISLESFSRDCDVPRIGPMQVKASTEYDTIRRKVEFLTEQGDFREEGEMYSGMWWQNKDTFLSTTFKKMYFLEQATFLAFLRHKQKKLNGGIRLTRDWLDLSVEHMSKYVKHIDWYSNQRPGKFHEARIADILSNYIEKSVEFPKSATTSVVESTMALLPLKAPRREAQNKLVVMQMAATLISIWKVGIGRTVVVGVSDQEATLAKQAFELVTAKLRIRPMEVAYVQHFNATGEDRKLVPKVALMGLQNAFHQLENSKVKNEEAGASVVEDWLGKDPTRWQYVYFSEPDLILVTRPSALSDISQALKDGKLMAAHRLEPVPHESDFPTDSNERHDQSFLLPNHGSFSVFTHLEDRDVCCDQGIYYPAHLSNVSFPEKSIAEAGCNAFWSLCGFERARKNYTDPSVILEMHYRLLGYPLLRLDEGTGLPVVGASQRLCVPTQGPASCARE